jgi:hypothetical protein
MKIYVVLGGGIMTGSENTEFCMHIYEVFDSKEKAEKFVAEAKAVENLEEDNYFSEYEWEIEEYEVK